VQKYTALILARVNSSRIKKKNFINFYGKPMYTWSVNAILKTKTFNKIFLSTDNEKIFLKKSRIYQVFKRNKKNASKFATTSDAVLEFIKNNKNVIDQKYLLVAYGCAPFIKTNEILKGLDLIKKKNFDSLWTISKIDKKFHPIKILKVQMQKIKYFHKNGPSFVNRQHLNDLYIRNGIAYFFSRDTILKKKKILPENTGYVVIKENVFNIDNFNDLKKARIEFNTK
jgi:CMP-N-acetylneuraminic acid synthetase